jgi:hypothetical protein
MFIAAYEGYFDKEDIFISLCRKISIAASAGFIKSSDFDLWWPAQGVEQEKKVWGTPEEAMELRLRIEKSHGIKLSNGK